MVVDYIIAGSGSWGSATLLFDNSAGDANQKFAPGFDDQIYATPGYGAANNIKVPMANTQSSVPFSWSSIYASYAAAMASVAALRTALKGQRLHLRVTEGATVLYFPNATLKSSTADVHGAAVDHTVTFLADDVTLTAP